MADLIDTQAAQTIKIIGADSSGLENNPVGADSDGNLQIISPNIDVNNAPATDKSALIAGKEPISGDMIPVKVDSEGRIVTTAITGFGAEFTFGDFFTVTTGQFSVRRTAYIEQTTDAQRSLVSTSASDSAAGTGARTILITYYTAAGLGPLTETVILNGTTPVDTTNSDICFIEKFEVITVGSTGSNVGIISLKAAVAGGGVTIGTIAATDNQTFWCHHYVPSGKVCNITGVSVGNDSTAVGNGSLFVLKAIPIGVSAAVEQQISDFVTLFGQSSSIYRNYASPIRVAGPARIVAYVTPNNNTDQTQRCAFDFFEP